MNESDAQALLDDLLDSVPDRPAPLGELGAAGERARRRARRRTVAAAGAAAAVVVGAAVLVPRLAGGGASAPEAADATTQPWPTATSQPTQSVGATAVSPSPGTQFVGLGQIVLEVPRKWTVGPIQDCTAGSPGDVYVSDYGPQCETPGGSLPSVVIVRRYDPDHPPYGLTHESTSSIVNGLRVDRTTGTCPATLPSSCTLTAYVPAESIEVLVGADGAAFDVVSRVVDTLRLLPEGQRAPTAPQTDADLPSISTSCCETPPAAPVLAGTYELQLDGVAAGTLTFEGGRLTGYDGCNGLVGSYVQQSFELRFPRSELGSELKGCADEPPVVAMLLEVRHLRPQNDRIVLYSGADESLANLRRLNGTRN